MSSKRVVGGRPSVERQRAVLQTVCDSKRKDQKSQPVLAPQALKHKSEFTLFFQSACTLTGTEALCQRSRTAEKEQPDKPR
eukprot:4976224-Amphidinium_carterae.1